MHADKTKQNKQTIFSKIHGTYVSCHTFSRFLQNSHLPPQQAHTFILLWFCLPASVSHLAFWNGLLATWVRTLGYPSLVYLSTFCCTSISSYPVKEEQDFILKLVPFTAPVQNVTPNKQYRANGGSDSTAGRLEQKEGRGPWKKKGGNKSLVLMLPQDILYSRAPCFSLTVLLLKSAFVDFDSRR